MEEYTVKQVVEHNKPDDAWLIIHGNGKSKPISILTSIVRRTAHTSQFMMSPNI